MDPDRVQELVRWAGALERSDTADLRAAGRAIRALCAENEELRRRVDSVERDRDEPGEGPPPGLSERPARTRRARRAGGSHRKAVAVATVAVLAALTAIVAKAAGPGIRATGPPSDAIVGAAELKTLTVSADAARGQSWLLDGEAARPARRGERLVLALRGLDDGPHTVTIRDRGRFFTSASRSFSFVVDTTPPPLQLSRPATVRPGKPVTVTGTVEPGARLDVSGRRVPLDDSGRFRVRAPSGTRTLVAVATDAAGNSSRWRIPVTVVPRRPREPIRAVHVTAYAWADATLRAGILTLVRDRKVNAVELDLKDESGEIGWNAPVPLARRMGSALKVFDLEQAVRQLHAQGVRVIGRLVCFRDPIHAGAAWGAGRRDEVVQTSGGAPYSGYGGFTNFANAAVRKYNVDVAVAAVKLGVDEILYDYVRRPDGPLPSMRFPGLRGTPEQEIVRFLRESRLALAGTKAVVGASVFGVAATRPTEVAQDIPAMAREVDYIAPMLYPSHWAPGEYGVADPNGEPYAIVRRSLVDFQRQVRGTGARVVPWLQDFSLGRDYGAAEVRAQIDAAREAGADEFILWDAGVTYTSDALDPTARRPALGFSTAPSANAPGPVRLPDAKPAEPRLAATKTAGRRPLSGLAPNELGVIPVVMHHMIRPDRVGEYDQTPQEFRAELEVLWRRGFVPIRVSDLLDGRIDIPRGTSPVVMTFDDSTKYQLALGADGEPKPDTAVGIMLEFARTHPGFEPAGTFYPNREPFAGVESARLLRWLSQHGFELGNHTHDHTPLRTLDDREVQRQLVLGAEVISKALPAHRIRSMALPLGSLPRRESLAVQGNWGGRSYGPYAVLLVGANPAPSPFSSAFDRAAIPRIRTSHVPWNGEADFGFAYWMRELQRHPASRYVSDGDPRRITFPAAEAGQLAERFQARARPLG